MTAPATVPAVSLRRADWRFLLPAPATGAFEHLVLLGGPPGLAARLREVGVARHVTSQAPAERCADAVAVLYDAPIAPGAAARCLKAGGVYYCEVDRRRPAALGRTPTRVRRALAAAGLAVTGTYCVLPDFNRARRYLPLDDDAVLAWYFATLQTTGSAAAFLAELVVRRVVRGDWRRIAPLVPCFGITAVAGAASDTMPSVLGRAAAPPGVSSLRRTALLTSGQDDGSRVVLLPFAPGSAEPNAVLKVTRLPAFNSYTEREQATLARLRAQLDAQLRATVPAPLGVYRYGELLVGVESCAPGRALVASSGRWRAPLADAAEDLRLAAGWLVRFHQQARCTESAWRGGLSERVDRRLDEYRTRLASTTAEERLLSLALERSATLGDAAIPSVWMHNDYAPWNVHRAGSRLTVIDWELGGEGDVDRVGPPLCDLLYFVTCWYHRVRRLRGSGAELRGIRELFLDRSPANPAVDVARGVIRDYLAGVGVDPLFHPLLLVYTWVDRALDRTDRRQIAERTTVPLPNLYRAYVRQLAAGAEPLFAERS